MTDPEASAKAAARDTAARDAAARDAARRRFERTVHTGFLLVLVAAVIRYLIWLGEREPLPRAAPVLTLAGFLAALYLAGSRARPWSGRGRHAWLLALVVTWTALTVTSAPFSWCAVPLFFLVLHEVSTPAAIPIIGWLAVVAGVVSALHARAAWDPSPLFAPLIIAVLATVIFRQLHRENARRQALIDDLVRTRDALATAERGAGVLQERVRLSQEIHDTLAQGLSSMHLLLNAADQQWSTAPDEARAHVRQAADTAKVNLAEARRFVRDLAPPALDGRTLTDALARLCEGVRGPGASLVVDGEPYALGVDAEVALLRVAQGALANVVQHAGATAAVVTLTYLDGAVTLDVVDDGVGFAPGIPCAAPDRGFGLRAIRQRVEALGGTATVESAPGEGTALAVTLPVTDCATASIERVGADQPVGVAE